MREVLSSLRHICTDEVLAKGAEAIICLDKSTFSFPTVVKVRLPKAYREKELDERIRRERTRREARMLWKAYKASINVPAVLEVGKFHIRMEFIDGVKCGSECLEFLARSLVALHKHGLIHGDLTPANCLRKGKEFYVIDFGLGRETKRLEEMADDFLASLSGFKDREEEFMEAYLSFGGEKRVVKKALEIRERMRYA